MSKLIPIFQSISIILILSLLFYFYTFYESEDIQEPLKELCATNRNLNYSWCVETALPNNSSVICKIRSGKLGLILHNRLSFQRIIDLPDLFFVYSAYYINETYQIRVLGLGQTRKIKFVRCRLLDEYNRVYYTSLGMTNPITEDLGHPVYFYTCFIICIVPPKLKPPKFISISSTYHQEKPKQCKISNILKVQYPHPKVKYEFAACVKPVFNHQDMFGLLEWIEFNKLMGVEHFTIYVLSMSKEVRCAIESYGKNEIEIRDWNPPLRDSPLTLRNAMLAAMNDCLYKYKGLAKYILFSDIDEFIVPNVTTNFSTLLKSINVVQNIKNESFVGYYKFENGWFFKCWPDLSVDFDDSTNHTMKAIINDMVLMKKNKLTQPFFSEEYKSYENRTKYITQTANTYMAGVHVVWERRNDTLKVQVSEKNAFSHHYRVSWEKDNCERPAIVDNSAHKFVTNVARRMYSKLHEVTRFCKNKD